MKLSINMSILWLAVVYITVLQIQGFDIGRKLWQDKAKSNGAETELTDFGSNMNGRSMPLLGDEFTDLHDGADSYQTMDTPDFAERGLPLFDDELHDQDAAIEPYLTKEIPEFAERRLLDDEQQDLDDAIKVYLNKDISDPVERGLPLLNAEQQDLEEQDAVLSDLTGADTGVDKRNSPTIFDMFNDIANRLDDIQDQVNELKEGRKLDNCPDGWYKRGKRCYFFSRHQSSWFDAMTLCQNVHGYLAEINDYYENAYLWGKAKSLNGFFWVGGTDLFEEDHWMWVHSQTPFTDSVYQDWGKGEPSNSHGGKENCLVIRPNDDRWNDRKCNDDMFFICEAELK